VVNLLKIKKFNCAPKIHEQVELPTREQVHAICYDLKAEIVDHVFSVDDIVKQVGRFIARRFKVTVLHAQAWEVESAELNINAFYDPERDERQRPSIELILVTNPNDTHLILDNDLWNLFINRLADSLAHELIHMYQARARNFLYVEHQARRNIQIDENLVYLSDPDEIDAYAYNIATELREHPNPLSKLVNPAAVSVNDSINLWAYIQAFSKDIKNPVVKRLLKKVYKNLT
jgi:pyrimidine operon attenuation protein/uracil phosphoribosyltransferase